MGVAAIMVFNVKVEGIAKKGKNEIIVEGGIWRKL